MASSGRTQARPVFSIIGNHEYDFGDGVGTHIVYVIEVSDGRVSYTVGWKYLGYFSY